jgi:hypothetical protein
MNRTTLSALRDLFPKGAALVAAACVSACIFGGGGTEVGGGSASSDVQFAQSLVFDDGRLRTQFNLCDSEFADLEFRISGDNVEIEWGMTVGEAEMPFVDIYSRKADGAFPEGTLTRIGSRVRATAVVLQANAALIDSVKAFQDFMYANEVIYVKNGMAGFAYPKLFVYTLRRVDFENPEISFSYKGNDSLVMKQGEETVTVKQKPFQSLTVRSSDPEHEPVEAELDSCTNADAAVYESAWLLEFLGQDSEVAKVSAQGARRRAGR